MHPTLRCNFHLTIFLLLHSKKWKELFLGKKFPLGNHNYKFMDKAVLLMILQLGEQLLD